MNLEQFEVSMTPSDNLKERYRASMLLSAAGDALGYKNQEWEYCKSGECRSSYAEMSSDQGYYHIDLLTWVAICYD